VPPNLNATSASVDVKSLAFEVIRQRDLGPGSSATKLTPRRFVKICHHVENGASITDACRFEGVTYRALRFKLANSEKLQRRMKQAESVRANVRFEHACQSIMQAGEQSWMAHAWWLERSYPQLFALRTVNRDNSEAKQAEPEIPAEILARHRRLILETLAENQAAAELQALPSPDDSEHSTK
jgi:hypothetical protein